MTRRVEDAIEEFILKKCTNKDGVIYNSVNEYDREFVQEVLNKFYPAFELLFQNKDDAEELFCERLSRLNAVRFDNKDENLYPLKYGFDSIRKHEKGQLEGGVTTIRDEGVFIYDIDYIRRTKEEAIHTLVHELIHLFSADWKTGLNGERIMKAGFYLFSEEDAMLYLNEGFTELVAQRLWSKMYPGKRCPGLGRYKLYVNAVKLILSQFVDSEQLVEDFIVDARLVVDRLKNQVDIDNNDMFTYISNISKEEIKYISVQQKVIKKLKSFEYSEKNKML